MCRWGIFMPFTQKRKKQSGYARLLQHVTKGIYHYRYPCIESGRDLLADLSLTLGTLLTFSKTPCYVYACLHRDTKKEPVSLNKTLPILPASPPLPAQPQVDRWGRTQSGCVTSRRTISAQRRHVQAAVHQQINAFDTDNIVLPYTGTPLGASRCGWV